MPVEIQAVTDRNALVRDYSPLIWSIIHKYTRGSATEAQDDIFNEVILHLYREDSRVLKSYDGRAKFSTWLYVVVRAKVLDLVEKRAREQKRFIRPDTDQGKESLWNRICEQPEEEDDDIELFEEKLGAMRNSIEALEPGRKAFIVDLMINEMSTEAMMEKYGLNSNNSVYSRKNKILAELRERMLRTAGEE